MVSLSILGALEFGSIWMLGWLAAAGIPLALHLLHRRRQQEVAWAAMELLLRAIQQNSRTLRIEGWLLLLLRTLALLLLGVALARPLLRSQADAVTGTTAPPRLWVIVLDASYSMGYTAGRQSVWQQAQAAASNLVSQAAPNDAFMLIQLSEPSQAVISQPAFDAQRVQAEIQRLQCTDGGGDLISCLEILRQTLEDAQQNLAGGSAIQIVFFTDMGQDTWQAATRDPLKTELRDLSSKYQVQIESLAPESPQNLAITALETESLVVLKGRPLQCWATIHNYSTTPATRVPVQFQAEGSTQQTEFIDCPPGQSRNVFVQLPSGNHSIWSISAVLPDDRLAVDNRRDLVVAVKPQIRVATVEETSGAARLINLSLAPTSLDRAALSTQRGMSVETWSPFDLQSRTLSELHTLILTDITEVSSTAVSKLKSYVEAGGSLLLLVGPRANPAAWNQPEGSLSELTGIQLTEPSNAGDWHIDPLNYASPVARPFANYLDAGLLTTPIFRYWKIVAQESSATPLQTDLALDSGDPLLVRRQLGEGAVAVLLSAPESGASALDLSANWNAIATWPSFVPIMQKTVETLMGSSEGQLNLLVGQPMRGTTTSTSPALELIIDRPDNTQNKLTVPVSSSGNRRVWIYSGTDRAGLYKTSLQDPAAHATANTVSAGQPANERLFALNILPNQSDLTALNPAAIQLAAGPESNPGQAQTPLQLNDQRPNEWLARVCLWGLLLTLIGESCLAWHLGRRLA